MELPPPQFLVRSGYGCVGLFGDVVLLLPVADGGADGVFGEDRTVDLDRRQGEFLDDVGVGDGEGFGDGLALDPLGGEGAGGDGRAAAEGLELSVLDDLGFGVDADLETHDVAALGCADEAGAYALGGLVEGADVAGVLVVVYYFFAVCHDVSPRSSLLVDVDVDAECRVHRGGNLPGLKPVFLRDFRGLKAPATSEYVKALLPPNLVCGPLDFGQVDAFFHHFVEGADRKSTRLNSSH